MSEVFDFKDVDIEIMDMLDDVAVTYMIVLTKIDKVKSAELKKRLDGIHEKLKTRPAAFPVVFYLAHTLQPYNALPIRLIRQMSSMKHAKRCWIRPMNSRRKKIKRWKK